MTAPVGRTPVTCSLWVDGGWVADGSRPEDDDATPVVLSGLEITWGRATTVDQVEPSTATFDLLDPPGGASFMSLLYTGARVDVTAAGTVPAPPTLPINRDISFETYPPGTVPDWKPNVGSHVVIVADRAATGAQSARLYGVGNTSGGALVRIPPAPFTPGNPAGWDDIPRMQAGENWAATTQVQTPVGGYVQFQLMAWETPDPVGSGGLGSQFGPWLTRIDADPTSIAWETLTIPPTTVPAHIVGQWVGMWVSVAAASWQSIRPLVGDAPNPVAWQDAAGSWEEWNSAYLDDLELLAPSSADVVHRDVTVFSGRITDLDAGWDASAGGVICSVIAADFTADLAQRDVGAEPWPAEPLSARFARIVAAAGVTVPYQIAPTLAGYRVTWMDVDRQQCWPLLSDLATSVDGVLWSATHRLTGPYLWLADPRTQSALYVLSMVGGVVVIAPTQIGGDAIEIDACDLLLDPVVFRQAVSDVSTRVAVTWMEQTVDDAGQPAPTERTDTFIDAALEVQLGTRRVAVSTLLTSAVDADAVAALILGRLRLASWRVGGLTWRTDTTAELDGDRIARVLDLLDGTRRLAAALLLTDLPDWSPAGPRLPLLLQGGTYAYEDGQWTLNLTTSSAAAQGSSLAWSELDPGWAWNEFDPTIVWSDLVGVAA